MVDILKDFSPPLEGEYETYKVRVLGDNQRSGRVSGCLLPDLCISSGSSHMFVGPGN